MLLLRARHLSERFSYLNVVSRISSEFFLISVFIFKSVPLLCLDGTRCYLRPRLLAGKMANPRVEVKLTTLHSILLNDRKS